MDSIAALLASFPNNNNNNVERQVCSHGAFYHCGNFEGCCGIDPCAFQHSANPCQAAQAEGGDGSDNGDDTSAGTEPTSIPDFTTRNIGTDIFTITLDDPVESTSTSSPSSSSSSPSASASSSANPSRPSTLAGVSATTTTDSTTLSTSVISTGTSTDSATRTLPVTPLPTTSSQDEDSSGPHLPESALVGVSIIGAGAIIGLLVAFFWFARRRRLSKRMSSCRGGSTPLPSPSLSVFNFGRGGDPTGTALGAGSSLPTSTTIHNAYSQHHQHHHHQEKELPAEPEPAHVELDSGETQRLGAQSTTDTAARGTRQPPLPAVRIHPPQLTPGFGGAHMAAQHYDGGEGVNNQSHRDSTSFPRVVPRATLNATEDERMNNQYANSWAYGP
ncbi:hypothetical protein F5Y03DRAFT_395296 [Xylaria venustula]|nr:hypothetical protein F5Y03DRAFT_395296 [Xylaria venustula]